MPASPLSHGSNCFSVSSTGIRSWTAATNAFGSVIIIVQDKSACPVSGFFQESHRPAAVRIGEPSSAVKYHGCLPCGVSCHS